MKGENWLRGPDGGGAFGEGRGVWYHGMEWNEWS